jgi:hypothetical protein
MTPLKDRLATLPWVLAGPILRKVTAKSVTVWVALQETALITLSVKEGSKEVATGTRSTVAVGVNLHMAAITARPTSGDLKAGIVYHYDLQFVNAHKAMDLGGATKSAELSYGTTKLPSFSLPPPDISAVRLFHGSCRMPHANGADAMALLDVLIEQAAGNATARPHQLLLTGDQIYADDVAAALLPLLTDAGDTLLYGASGPRESLPEAQDTRAIPPYWRYHYLDEAGFTSDDMRSHLMSLGEYLAMYLFTWSDVLWPVSGQSADLPVTETIKRLTDHLDDATDDIKKQWKKHPKEEIWRDGVDVQRHFATLFRVRRALANIPTAMIFDDHEITDDWNMTLGWCRDVYSNALARRVVQNGLVAYALCQHWGNVPEVFEKGTTTPPGAALLALLDGKNASDYATNSPQLQKITGLRTKPDWRDDDPASLAYNYTVEADAYQVIVTDTRTWRTFPDGNNTTGHFLPGGPSNQLRAQITNTPPLNGRVLMAVVTTNAPPTEPIRTAERNPWKTRKLGGSAHPDIYDGWRLPSVVFDRLLVALSDKLPAGGGRTHQGSVILLSGDVHHSFSARLKYRATKRFEDATAQPASVVFVELVASSFKKQTGNTVMLHREGFTGAPTGGHEFVPPHTPEGYVGYNLPAGTTVAQHFEVASAGGAVATAWKDIDLESGAPLGVPTVALGHADEKARRMFDTKEVRLVKKPPDFRYRLDYLEADVQGQQPLIPPTIAPFPPTMSRTDAIREFNRATNFYRDYSYKGFSKQQIVGLNNIGEITFERAPVGIGFVNHTVRWKPEDSIDFQWCTWRVYVNPEDDVLYKDVKAETE